jgi:hypothetical protein
MKFGNEGNEGVHILPSSISPATTDPTSSSLLAPEFAECHPINALEDLE